MKAHHAIAVLLDRAEQEHRCAFARTRAQYSALLRRAMAGELVRPFTALFCRAEHWSALTPPERTLYIARALAMRHPAWVFTDVVAAAVHGFEHPWMVHDGTVSVAVTGRGGYRCGDGLRHRYVPARLLRVEQVGTMRVTARPDTLVDCAMSLDFRCALPMFDSALSCGVAPDDILMACDMRGRGLAEVHRLLRFADPKSENGGESFVRGTFLEEGFRRPNTQVRFTDPETGRRYRVDYAWRLDDGRVIVAELDGQDKYVDPRMTGGATVASVIAEEKERQEAVRRFATGGFFRFTFAEALGRRALTAKALKHGVPRADNGLRPQRQSEGRRS